MKFRDRIVLKDLVIPPEWVRIYAPYYGYVEYARPDTGLQPSPVHTIHFSECRIDRATGMVDSTGEWFYYENNKAADTIELGEGIVKMVLGEWRIVLRNPSTKYSSVSLHEYAGRFTITGMVPWEET